MPNWKNEREARENIKHLVSDYYNQFIKKTTKFEQGDRISYAGRVFDDAEMCALTDSMLD